MSKALRAECEKSLVDSMSDDSAWTRVRAAEALAKLGQFEEARDGLQKDAATNEPMIRIVTWRVLARAAENAEARAGFVDRIRKVLLDPAATDRTHALEALAKLREPMRSDAERKCVHDFAIGGGSDAPFALWREAQAGDVDGEKSLVELLASADVVVRLRAASILDQLSPLSHDTKAALKAALDREPSDSLAIPYLKVADNLAGARVLAADEKAPVASRTVAVSHLAETGDATDLPLLSAIVRSAAGDFRVAAAYAALRIDQRANAPKPATRTRSERVAEDALALIESH